LQSTLGTARIGHAQWRGEMTMLDVFWVFVQSEDGGNVWKVATYPSWHANAPVDSSASLLPLPRNIGRTWNLIFNTIHWRFTVLHTAGFAVVKSCAFHSNGKIPLHRLFAPAVFRESATGAYTLQRRYLCDQFSINLDTNRS
jgi:hypothetical protein